MQATSRSANTLTATGTYKPSLRTHSKRVVRAIDIYQQSIREGQRLASTGSYRPPSYSTEEATRDLSNGDVRRGLYGRLTRVPHLIRDYPTVVPKQSNRIPKKTYDPVLGRKTESVPCDEWERRRQQEFADSLKRRGGL